MNDKEKEEWQEGKLCEKGLMKERFVDGDLKRTLTAAGKQQCKEALKDKKYQHWLIDYTKSEIKKNPARKDEILEGLRLMLLELNHLKE